MICQYLSVDHPGYIVHLSPPYEGSDFINVERSRQRVGDEWEWTVSSVNPRTGEVVDELFSSIIPGCYHYDQVFRELGYEMSPGRRPGIESERVIKSYRSHRLIEVSHKNFSESDLKRKWVAVETHSGYLLATTESESAYASDRGAENWARSIINKRYTVWTAAALRLEVELAEAKRVAEVAAVCRDGLLEAEGR